MIGDYESTVISEFWNNHFEYTDASTPITKTKCWNFFNLLHGCQSNYHSFTSISGRIGIRSKNTKKKKKLFLITPISREGKIFFKNCETTKEEDGDNMDMKGKIGEGEDEDEEEGDGEHEGKGEDDGVYIADEDDEEEMVEEFIIIDEYNLEDQENCENDGKQSETLKTNGRRRRQSIQNFWQQNYHYSTMGLKKIKVSDVHAFFLQKEPDWSVSLQDFHEISLENMKIRIKHDRKKKTKFYYANPISSAASIYHGYVPEQTSSTTSSLCGFHLVNIQGLISNKVNKCDFLNLITSSSSTSKKIIAITETHLNSKQHFDAEIMKYFQNFNILRADRDTEYNIHDEFQLQSHGGCLLLTSPDIITIPKLLFSNGNCELVIAECPELETSIIVVYRPPKPNFSLHKFKEVISKITKYLEERDASGSTFNSIMAGDFNFPSCVVEWILSKDGIFPNIKLD